MSIFQAFQNLTRFVVNSACYKFLAGASLHNYFVELDKMQVNMQGVEHNLQRIEQIDSGLCNNEDKQCVIQELRSKYMNEQQQLCKLCFFNLEALAKDAVGQNLIPDNIFVLVFFLIVHHLEIMQYKFTDIC